MEEYCGQESIYRQAPYAELYELELDGFIADLPFYRQQLGRAGYHLLEIGCGAGRLSRALAADGHGVVGMDLSAAMLQRARARHQPGGPSYVCMDMTRMAFACRFDAILVPYNTLNLLTEPSLAERFLKSARALVSETGRLMGQLFIPDQTTLAQAGRKQFQFQILQPPGTTKVIKEIWKMYDSKRQQLQLTEKYYIRPQHDPASNRDLACSFPVVAHDLPHWQRLFKRSGWQLSACCGDYDLAPFVEGATTICLFVAQPCPPASPESPGNILHVT